MANHEFRVGHLDKLDDGRLSTAFQVECDRAVRDVLDRPNVGAARKVTLQVEISPGYVDDSGACEEVIVTAAVKNTLPVLRTRPYKMSPKRNGRLIWNDLAPDNAFQKTIDGVTAVSGAADFNPGPSDAEQAE
jgi:hypothetical protein